MCFREDKHLTKDQYKYLDATEKETEHPEDFIASTEIRDAMDQLLDDLRKVLILHYFNDQSIKEIANILSIPEGTVKSRLSRAREQLKEHLDG